MSLFGGGNETFEVILSARDQGLSSTLAHADSSLDATAERVKRLAEAFLIFEAARKTVDIFKDITTAAAGQQAVFAKVKTSVIDSGDVWRGYGQVVIKTLKDQAAAHGFAVTDMGNSFSKLETATGNSQKAFQLLGVAQDLSRAKGIPLTNVALALGKAYDGNATALQRVGVIVPKVTTSTDLYKQKIAQLTAEHIKLTPAMKNLESQAKAEAAAQDKTASAHKAVAIAIADSRGQADAYANTAAGQYARVQVSVDELEASIGKKLLPTETAALKSINTWVDELTTSKRVSSDASAAAQSLANGFAMVVTTVREVGPPLLEAADDVKALVDSVGGIGTVLAFGTAWYGVSKSVALAGSAIKAVEGFSTPAAIGARAGAVSTAARVATVGAEAAPALPLMGGGYRFGGAGSTGNYAAEGADAEKAATGIEDVGAAAEKAGPSLAGFGAGVAESFTGVGAATVAVGLLAGGLYYLSQQSTASQRSAQRTAAGFDLLAASANKFNSASKNIGDDKLNTSSDKIARQQASLSVAQAKATLADPSLNQDALAHKQNILALAEAYNQWRLANHAVQSDLSATSGDTKKQADAANGTQVAISRLAHSLTSQANAAKTGIDVAHDYAGAHGGVTAQISAEQVATDKAAASLAAFTASTRTHAAALQKSNPDLSHATQLLGEFAQSQQRVPSKAEITFVLNHAKSDDDLQTITGKLNNFDKKKATAELGLNGYVDTFGKLTNLRDLIQTLNGQSVVIPIAYTSSGLPPGGGGGPKKPGGATGMAIHGAYGADDVPVWVTGGEVILNPTQIGLVNSGYTVHGAMAATGAPSITRGGSYSTGGGDPLTALDNITPNASNTTRKKTSKKKGSSGTKVTPAQAAENEWQADQKSLGNTLAPIQATYARDQANQGVTKAQLVRDINALKAQVNRQIGHEKGYLARFKHFPNVIGEINSTLSSDYGTLGGYRGDLTNLLNPSAAAPGADAYTKAVTGAGLKLTKDQANATGIVPKPILDKHGKVTNKKQIAAATALIAAAKANIPRDRSKLIALTQERIAKLKGFRKERKYKPLWGAIFDEIGQDQQSLYGYVSDKNSDAQTAADNASQAAATAAQSTFDDTAFEQQVTALQTAIAGDQAALPAGGTGSTALTSDTQALYDLVSGRVGAVEGLISSGALPNAASVNDAQSELGADFGILSGITQGSTGAGGSVAATSTAQSADDSAQIAQLQQQIAIQTRSAALSDATVSAFGSSGDIGSGGYGSAYGSAQGGGNTIVINTLHPGDPATLTAIGNAATAGQSLQQSIPSGRMTVNL